MRAELEGVSRLPAEGAGFEEKADGAVKQTTECSVPVAMHPAEMHKLGRNVGL
jgi:hypothetical protein